MINRLGGRRWLVSHSPLIEVLAVVAASSSCRTERSCSNSRASTRMASLMLFGLLVHANLDPNSDHQSNFGGKHVKDEVAGTHLEDMYTIIELLVCAHLCYTLEQSACRTARRSFCESCASCLGARCTPKSIFGWESLFTRTRRTPGSSLNACSCPRRAPHQDAYLSSRNPLERATSTIEAVRVGCQFYSKPSPRRRTTYLGKRYAGQAADDRSLELLHFRLGRLVTFVELSYQSSSASSKTSTCRL